MNDVIVINKNGKDSKVIFKRECKSREGLNDCIDSLELLGLRYIITNKIKNIMNTCVSSWDVYVLEDEVEESEVEDESI